MTNYDVGDKNHEYNIEENVNETVSISDMANSGNDSHALISRWVELGLLVSWISRQSGNEISALSDYIEDNTGQLVVSFQDIASKATQQSNTVSEIVEKSTNVIVNGETKPLVEVVENLDGLITYMIDDVLDISKRAMNMVYIMEQAVKDSKEINTALEDIFQITKVTKYLSINALIEAARAGGDTGRSFGVVATGVRDLSHSTQELAERMEDLISGLSEKLKDSFDLLEGIASKDMTEQIQMKENINATMSALIEQSEQQKAILEQTASSSVDISSTVSKLIMAMQFQDYAKQRMQHLIEASSEVQNKVSALLDESKNEIGEGKLPEELSEQAINDLLDKFCLSKFKGDFLNGIKGTPEVNINISSVNSDDGINDDIDLFGDDDADIEELGNSTTENEEDDDGIELF